MREVDIYLTMRIYAEDEFVVTLKHPVELPEPIGSIDSIVDNLDHVGAGQMAPVQYQLTEFAWDESASKPIAKAEVELEYEMNGDAESVFLALGRKRGAEFTPISDDPHPFVVEPKINDDYDIHQVLRKLREAD